MAYTAGGLFVMTCHCHGGVGGFRLPSSGSWLGQPKPSFSHYPTKLGYSFR